MDNEDLGVTLGSSWYVQEMNVVLSNGHDGLVRCIVGCFLDVGPREGTGVSRLEITHVKEEELALRESIENVGVVVENGIERGKVEGAGIHGLSSP